MKRTCTKHAFAAHLTRSLFGTWRHRTAFFKVLTLLVSLDMMLLGALPVLALPQGGTVKSGDVTFDDASAGTLIVNQASGKASIDWAGGFDIGAGELVKFVQPGSSSVAVNRDSSGSLSEIWGSLQANGQIYLLNANGILFGSGSSVNVGGLIAAAMNSMEGGYGSDSIRFSGGGGSVTVQGGASISAGKYAYLIGSVVDNAGSISAGDVILAAGAGDSIELVREPDGSTISIVIGGTPQDASETSGGDVASGETPASESPAEGLAQGTVQNSGVINASGEVGGNVQMQATDIVHTGSITADGALGNGGAISIMASDDLAIGAESVTTANAGLNGDGGSIYLVAEDTLLVATGSRIEARGGSESGDGGFVETSGHQNFAIGTSPDVTASSGNGGTWLIDPYKIEIVAGAGTVNINGSDPFESTGAGAQLGVDLILSALAGGATVDVTTGDGAGGDDGSITLSTALDYDGTGANSLIFNAYGDIIINGLIFDSLGTGADLLNLTLNANADAVGSGSVVVNNNITLGGGTFTASGVAFDSTASTITTGDADILVMSTSGDIAAGSLNAGAGDLTLIASGDISQTGSFTANAVNLVGGAITLNSANDINTLSGTAASMAVNDVDGLALGTVTTTGDLTINAGGPLVDAAGANVTVGGNAAFSGTSISVGNADFDSFMAGSLTFNSGGAVSIYEDDATLLTGISTAGSLALTSAGAIAGDGTANTTVGGNAAFNGTSINVGDVAGDAFAAGSLTFNSAGAVVIEEDDATLLTGISTVGSLVLGSAGAIADAAGASLTVGVGDTVLNGQSITLDNADNDYQGNVIAHALSTVGGSIVLNDKNAIILTDVDTANGSIGVTAGGQITATDVATGGTAGEDIALTATVDGIEVVSVGAGAAGNVALDAATAITKSGAGLVTANALTADAATGIDLNTAVATLDASVTGAGDLAIDQMGAIDLANVDTFNGSIAVTASGQITATDVATGGTAGEDIALTATVDGIEVVSVGAGAAGNVALDAATAITKSGAGLVTANALTADAATGIDLNTAVATLDASVTGTGDIAIDQTGAIDLTDVDTFNGSIAVTASGQITATDVASLTDNDANDITLTGVGIAVGSIVAGAGSAADVMLNAGTGAISDLQNDTVGHDADGFATQTGDARADNIVADQLKMTADGDIGAAGNPLDTTVNTLAANSANGSVYVYETDALTIGTVDGLIGVTAANHAKVETINGTLTVDQAVAATAGDVLLAANGAGSDVALNADVMAGRHATVLAEDTVRQNANMMVGLRDASNPNDPQGSIDVKAVYGSVIMLDGTVSMTQGGNIRYIANQGADGVDNDGDLLIDEPDEKAAALANGQDVKLSMLSAQTTADRAAASLEHQSDWGDVQVVAGRHIVDANADRVDHSDSGIVRLGSRVINVFANGLQFIAGGTVGEAGTFEADGHTTITTGNPLDIEAATLAATADGGMYLLESTDIAVDTVEFAGVNRVGLDSSATPGLGNLAMSDLASSAGPVKLAAANGTIIVNDGDPAVQSVGMAGLGISAGGDVLLDAYNNGNEADVVLNAGIDSVGSVTLLADDDIRQEVAGDIAAGGTIDVQTFNGSIIMRDAATDGVDNDGDALVDAADPDEVAASADVAVSQTTFGGNIRYKAAQDVTLGRLGAGAGMVSVVAGGNILDARADTVGHDAEGFATQTGSARTENIVASAAQLAAGGDIGAAGNPLDTEVATLAASAGGSAYLYESTGVTVDDVAFAGVTRVGLDSSAKPNIGEGALSDLRAGVNAKLETVNGTITVNEGAGLPGGVSATSGDVLLAANGAGSDVELNAAVTAGRHVTVLARDGVEQKVGGDITAGTADATNPNDPKGSIDVEAFGGSITMADGTISQTVGGNIRYAANQGKDGVDNDGDTLVDEADELADVAALQDVTLGTLNAGAGMVSVVAGRDIVDGNGAAKNIVGAAAQLVAGGSVGGAGAAAIDTQVGTLAARAGNGSVYVSEADALTLGTVGAIDVNRIGLDSSTTPLAGEELSAAVRAKQNVKIENGVDAAGDLTVSTVVGAGDDVLLNARQGDLKVDAAVSAGKQAGDDMTLLASGGVSQNAAGDIAAGGTIDVEAQTGSIDMDAEATATAGGNIRYLAAQNADITGLKGANVRVEATAGSITDAGETAKDVEATAAQLVAGGSVGGAGAAAIDTQVGTLAARASGGSVYVSEADALTLGTVGAIDVNRIGLDSSTTPLAGSALSGAVAGQNVKIENGVDAAGDLTVDQTVTATAGDVLLDAKNGAIDVNAQVSGQNVAVVATGDITENAAVDATGNKVVVSKTGDIVVNAASAQAQNVMYKAEAGSVALNAAVNAVNTLGIEAGQGDLTGLTIAAKNILLRATTGSIDLDVGAGAVNLAAAAGQDLDIDVAGDINIVDAGDFTVLRPTMDDVGANETIRGTAGATAGDDLALAVEGDLSATTVAAGGNADVAVGGSMDVGNVEAGNDLVLAVGGDLSADTVAAGGDADVAVGGDMDVGNLEAGNDLVLDVGGNLDADDIAAGGDAGIVVGGDMDAGSVVAGGLLEIESGDLTFDEMKAKTIVVGAGNIGMGQVSAGTAEFKAGGSITDHVSDVNVNTLSMIASGNIGSESSPIDMTTKTIREISGNNVYLRENASSSVTLGRIGARGELELAAPNIGIPGGDGGFVDGNGDANNIVAGGDVLLDIAGFFGQSGDPMELAIEGKLELRSGNLHGEQTRPSWIYFIYNGDPLRPEYIDDGSIPGLIIANNRVVGGHPDLVRKVNRALAFTVDTPELKSRQGVFGDVNFVHTDLDVSDANSIGVLDYLESEASDWDPLNADTAWGEKARVENAALRYWTLFKGKETVMNPSGLNLLYTQDMNQSND